MAYFRGRKVPLIFCKGETPEKPEQTKSVTITEMVRQKSSPTREKHCQKLPQ